MRKLIVLCLTVGFLYACSGPAADSEAGSSNDSGGSSERATPAAQPSDSSEATDTVVSAPPLEVTTAEPTTSSASSETAYDMPHIDERYQEGTNPDLEEDTEMYALVYAAQEGTPFVAHFNGFNEFYFKARTPYYLDMDETNEYGNVGSGSLTIANGNTDGATIYVELHTYIGTIRSDSCGGYECWAQVSWDGPD